MKLLAIDTTEAGCSAALMYDDQLIERFEIAPRRHSELILPMVDELLAEAGVTVQQLDCLGFARGPGSFTGVRIATAVTQGLAVAGDLPVVPVSSLLALAQGAALQYQVETVLAGFDARMQEVYWASCVQGADGLMQIQGEEQVCAPDQVPLVDGAWVACGSAWQGYPDVLQARLKDNVSRVDADACVHAIDVARLAAREYIAGNALGVEDALPVYLRDKVAEKAKKPSIA